MTHSRCVEICKKKTREEKSCCSFNEFKTTTIFHENLRKSFKTNFIQKKQKERKFFQTHQLNNESQLIETRAKNKTNANWNRIKKEKPKQNNNKQKKHFRSRKFENSKVKKKISRELASNWENLLIFEWKTRDCSTFLANKQLSTEWKCFHFDRL